MSQSRGGVTGDLRAVARRWRARPGVPVRATLVLTLGIGAGAAVLGTTWAVLLRPLPYPDADRLVLVRSAFPGMTLAGMGLSGPEAAELAGFTRTLDAVGFGYAAAGLLAHDGDPQRVDVARVSAGWIETMPQPARGRGFSLDDDRPGAPCRLLVARAIGDAVFGTGADPIGRRVSVDGEPCDVIGVWPDRADFAGRPVDVWVPLRYDTASASANRANHAFSVLARRRPDVSFEQARADLDRTVAGWMAATRQFHAPSLKFHPLSLTPLADAIRGPVRGTGVALAGAVALLLVVTVANASALLVVDADRRRAELTLRAALGASPARIWRLHVVEAGLMGVIVSVAGAGLAWAATQALVALSPPELADLGPELPWWQVMTLAAALAMAAAGAGGALQAVRSPRRALAPALDEVARGGMAAAPRQRLRGVLVALEMALAVALIAGAGVMVETVQRIGRVDLGFRPEGVLRAQITLPADRYDTQARATGFYEAVVAAIASRGDVQAAGAMTGPMPQRRANNTSVAIEGSTNDPHLGVPPVQFLQYLSPGAFAAAGLELRAGRLFTPADAAAADPVVIVNERAARVYFGDRDPIGRRLRPMGPTPWRTVVGIVRDARQDGVTREPGTEIFVPIAQAAQALGGGGFTRNLQLLVRARSGRPEALAPALREAVRAVDAGAAIAGVEPLEDAVVRDAATERLLMVLLTAFGGLAAALAGVGVYGMVAHTVTARTREIGVRRSLGASGRSVAGLVARQTVPLVVPGLAAGVGLAWAAAGILAPFSFEVDAASLPRLGAVALVLLVVAGAACARPIRSALRIDPAEALRRP